ncbi:hypothetical protein M0R36_10640 [bacterium]|jgi:hypothetical protein|nr:hypothetical protein [bacterium]
MKNIKLEDFPLYFHIVAKKMKNGKWKEAIEKLKNNNYRIRIHTRSLLPSEADKKIYYFECNKNGVIIKSPSVLYFDKEYTNKYRIIDIEKASESSKEKAKQFDREDEKENKNNIEVKQDKEKNVFLETAIGLIKEAIKLIDDPVYYKRSSTAGDGSPILTISKEQILSLLFNAEKHIKKGMEEE